MNPTGNDGAVRSDPEISNDDPSVATPPLAATTRPAHSSSFSSMPANVLTLNVHTASQWSHDLMIDKRLFDSLALGDVIEIRSANNSRDQPPMDWHNQPVHGFSDSASEADDSEMSYFDRGGDFSSGGHPLSSNNTTNATNLEESEADSTNPGSDPSNAHLILMEVTTLDPPLGRVQISINHVFAEQFNFQRYHHVRIAKLSPESKARYEAAFVEVSFKSGYLSNGDLWLVRSALEGKPVYVGKAVKFLGVKLRVDQIHHVMPEGGVDESKKAKYGIISKRTRFVFRSGSASIYWLIQCSVEMWGFADDGDLMVERLFNRFIPDILDRWNAAGAKHSLTVILFTRTVYNNAQDISTLSSHIPLQRFGNPDDPRYYADFYHVALNNVTRQDWRTVLGPLQEAFHLFPKRAGWATRSAQGACGLPSMAQEGNVLEAINLTLNIMQNQHIDRDLTRTGQLMVVMTAGSGVFEVDARLGKLTKDRMTNHAVGCDLISLTQPPSHIVPLFIHNPAIVTQSSFVAYEFDQPHPFYDAAPASKQNQEFDSRQWFPSGSHSSPESLLVSPLIKPSAFDHSHESGKSQQGSEFGGISMESNRGGGASKAKEVGNRLPLFSIPYWISLSYPFHRAQSKKSFQPIYENRMFSLPDASRSNFPSALLAPLERASLRTNLDLDLSTQVITWATNRRIPGREEMRPWFPLVADYRSAGRQQSSQQQQVQASNISSAKQTAPTETRRISSPGVFAGSAPILAGARGSALAGSLQSQGQVGAHPSSTRSTSSSSQQQHASPRAPSLTSRTNARLEPSPSLAAFQLFTGGQTDRAQPRVSWMQDFPGNFALPPASSRAIPQSRTFSVLPPLTTSSIAHDMHVDSTVSATSEDEAQIRAMQKKYDAQVFSSQPALGPLGSPGSVPIGSSLSSQGGRKRVVNASPHLAGISSALPITKQSINDLAAFAMTPSLGHKARPIVPERTSILMRGIHARKSELNLASVKLERTLTSSSSDDDGIMDSPSSHASSELSDASYFASRTGPTFTTGGKGEGVSSQIPLMPSSATSSQFVNPFRRESLMKWYYERPSHSRSRWLHLFPNPGLDGLVSMDMEEDTLPTPRGAGPKQAVTNAKKFGDDAIDSVDEAVFLGNTSADETKEAESAVGEINWKSLLTPAMMPLTTGFAPSAEVLGQNYSLAAYSLLGTRNMDQVLSDIICQRLAEDFQVYDPEDFLPAPSSDQAVSRPSTLTSPQPRSIANATMRLSAQAQGKSSTVTNGLLGDAGAENYILTIGHHVHVLSYWASAMKLEVRTFTRNKEGGQQQQDPPTEYRFLLWDSDFDEQVQAARIFQDERASEYSWSFIDILLLGDANATEFLPGTEFFSRFRRLTFCLFNEQAVRRLLTYLHEKVNGTSDQDQAESEEEMSKYWPYNQVQFELDWLERRPLNLKVTRGMTAELFLDLPKEGRLRPREWIYVNVDDRFHHDRAFHFEVHWMVASGDTVRNFIEDIRAAVGQGLVQVANYCMAFDDHPFIVPRRLTLETDLSLSMCCDILTKAKLMLLDSYSSAQNSLVMIRASDGSVLCQISREHDDDDESDISEDSGDEAEGTFKDQGRPLILEFLANPFVPCTDYPEFVTTVVDALRVVRTPRHQ